MLFLFFFFNDTATTEIYTLSLHDALPIYVDAERRLEPVRKVAVEGGHDPDERRVEPGRPERGRPTVGGKGRERSEEHTSELQSRSDLVCRLLLEKKKKSESSQHFVLEAEV